LENNNESPNWWQDEYELQHQKHEISYGKYQRTYEILGWYKI